ncbi:ISNCY family transposase [Robbsia andropogonis]|nr:ISNCY family transposase [Robbsia andropogonis]
MTKTPQLVTMTMRELDRIKVIQMVVDGMLRPRHAAERLGLTVRQIERLVLRFKENGSAAVASRARGKPSNRKLDPGIARRALVLIAERYPDFGPTFACEKLRECHGLVLSKETVRHLMTDAGFWVPRKQHASKVHQPRNRRACLGEMIQIDGSDHRWFEDRAPACTLLVFIDDATSRLMTLHFTQTESTFSYFEAMQRYMDEHGKPVALYSDKFSVFRVNSNNYEEKTFGKGITQFGRACFELNIDTWCANSSQAKGRVERANLTLQDRLVKEMRLREISTKEAANAYMPSFIADYNSRFAKPPKNDFDAHRTLRSDEDLRQILTMRVQRKVTNSLTLQYDRVIYLLEDTAENRALIHKYIDVFEYPNGDIEIQANGTTLTYRTYDRLSFVDQGAVVENKRLGHALLIAQTMQENRDNRRASGSPSRTNQGQAPRSKHAEPGTKTQRAMGRKDINDAIEKTSKTWNEPEQIVLKPSKKAVYKKVKNH